MLMRIEVIHTVFIIAVALGAESELKHGIVLLASAADRTFVLGNGGREGNRFPCSFRCVPSRRSLSFDLIGLMFHVDAHMSGLVLFHDKYQDQPYAHNCKDGHTSVDRASVELVRQPDQIDVGNVLRLHGDHEEYEHHGLAVNKRKSKEDGVHQEVRHQNGTAHIIIHHEKVHIFRGKSRHILCIEDRTRDQIHDEDRKHRTENIHIVHEGTDGALDGPAEHGVDHKHQEREVIKIARRRENPCDKSPEFVSSEDGRRRKHHHFAYIRSCKRDQITEAENGYGNDR